MKAHEIRLLYVADPMCSWCWGFAPVVRALEDEYRETLRVDLVLGGLRPGPHAEVVDERMKGDLRHHWEAVQQRSGQPFDFAFFQRDDFLYDTDPPSRAVVAVRRLNPDHALSYFHALQAAFYARNADITAADTLASCAEAVGIDAAAFHQSYNDPETFDLTQADYERARRMGVAGFPSVVLTNDRLALRVIHGWMPLEEARRVVDEGVAALASG